MRNAIYFSPPETHALTKTASAWLGRSAFGALSAEAFTAGLSVEEHRQLTSEPARYGFHATLKAPFLLPQDRTQGALEIFFDEFCSRQAPTLVPRLELTEIGPFFALTCGGSAEGINSLCNEVVEAFEPWRAPLTPEDMARRKPERLSERQRDLLERWGYPYVFEEFRFHMTLTGPVEEGSKSKVRDILQTVFSEHLGMPLPIEHLGLFVEAERGAPFTVVRHAELRGMGDRP
ncbi:DUF1045 domain-containing protein [Rhizobium lemnae]|uniref:DUF1045 domain-containing protein n=1 Tax=Rhizobium lemnae TaxID=1214924 RepID=A0ABV8E8G9_9HYPH|nr:DUF1045 domain-containing protein [Rhizobium lemnae]MCJ8507698.1 DUF1045 domain-containing protein [Rhizobium lemnae]